MTFHSFRFVLVRHLKTVLEILRWRPSKKEGMSRSDYLNVRTVSTSCFFCAVLNVESSVMEAVLMGSGGALGSSVGNLWIEPSEDLRSFIMAWREDIEPISLTSESSRILTTLKGLYMTPRPAITLMLSS